MEIRDQTDHTENTEVFNERRVLETIKKPKPKQTKSIKQKKTNKKTQTQAHRGKSEEEKNAVA